MMDSRRVVGLLLLLVSYFERAEKLLRVIPSHLISRRYDAVAAPEILVGNRYNQLADMWSVGCLIFMLIGKFTVCPLMNH